MSTTKNQTNVKKDVIKSLMWLIEATFRGFVGWALLSHSHNYVAIAAGVYALATGVLIVMVHFVKAHEV